MAQVLPDPRHQFLIEQSHEDLNDYDRLRDDLAMQTAVGKVREAASSPTLCRFEHRADRAAAVAAQRVLVVKFIASFAKAPEELLLDFDATDDLVVPGGKVNGIPSNRSQCPRLRPNGNFIEGTDVDRPGMKVAAQEKSQPEVFLSRILKNAVIVRASSLAGTLELLKSRSADAIFSIKPSLFDASTLLPDSQVLDGQVGLDPHAMAIPKGRDTGVAYARKFIEDAKSGGLVKAAIERAGIRGAVVAPTE